MKVVEICRTLEKKAPLAWQEDYDNSGLICGDPSMEVTGALLCLEITLPVMLEAKRKGCNLVISHHPFIFRPMKKFPVGAPETDILTLALKNDLAIYAIHTNLDNIRDGLNLLLLKKLGIDACSVLSPKSGSLIKLVTFCPVAHADHVRIALFEAGAGFIGNYDQCSFNSEGTGTFRPSVKTNPFVGVHDVLHKEPEVRIEVILPLQLEKKVVEVLLRSHPYEEVAYDIYPLLNDFPTVGAGVIGQLEKPMEESSFLAFLREKLSLPMIRHTSLRAKPVSKVALCTGSGSFLIGDALAAGADILITADLKYHDFFIPGEKMMLADIGHYESEHWVKEWLYAELIKKFPTFALFISEIDTNPVHYF